MDVSLVARDSVELTLVVAVSSTNAVASPLVAPIKASVELSAVSPAILWVFSLVNRVCRPVPVNEPASMFATLACRAVTLALAAVRSVACVIIEAASPSVTEVIEVALDVIVAASPSVILVMSVALLMIVAARPSVTPVIVAAVEVMVAAKLSELAVIAAVVATPTPDPVVRESVAALVTSTASF